MRVALVLVALSMLSSPAQAATTVELRLSGAAVTMLGSSDGGPAGLILPLGYGLGVRLSPTWRLGVFGGMGLFGFVGEAQVDHAPFGFAMDGPFLRLGAGALAIGVRCDADCDALGVGQMPFGVGTHLAVGGAWRWSFADDEGGISLGISLVGASLESQRSGVRRVYLGGSGPWMEIDW